MCLKRRARAGPSHEERAPRGQAARQVRTRQSAEEGSQNPEDVGSRDYRPRSGPDSPTSANHVEWSSQENGWVQPLGKSSSAPPSVLWKSLLSS